MLLSSVMHPLGTVYNISQTPANKNPERFPKLLNLFYEQKKHQYISFSKFEERVEVENDPTTKIAPGDQHFFPPNFHRIHAEKCKSRVMQHDSPWNENFGNTEKTPVKKQVGGEGEDKQKKKKTPKTKREMASYFVDVQIGILTLTVPKIGFLCDLKGSKQERKRKAPKDRAL